jgi:ribosomal protein L37AE/L43A
LLEVYCDEGCKKEFEISIREKNHGKGIFETYFECPHCGKHYISGATSPEVRLKQIEVKKLMQEQKIQINKIIALPLGKMKSRAVKKLDGIENKINRLTEEISEEMDVLRSELLEKV